MREYRDRALAGDAGAQRLQSATIVRKLVDSGRILRSAALRGAAAWSDGWARCYQS